MATIKFSATITGEMDLDIDLEEQVSEYLSSELGGAFDVDSIDSTDLIN